MMDDGSLAVGHSLYRTVQYGIRHHTSIPLFFKKREENEVFSPFLFDVEDLRWIQFSINHKKAFFLVFRFNR